MTGDNHIIAHIMKDEQGHPIFEIAFNVWPQYDMDKAAEMVRIAMLNMGYYSADYYLTKPVEKIEG